MNMKRNAVGMPTSRVVATLFTLPIQEQKEMGFFELAIHLDDTQLSSAVDPRALLFHTIAAHLASSIQSTGVPKDFWFVRFPTRIQKMFDLPEAVPLDGGLYS